MKMKIFPGIRFTDLVFIEIRAFDLCINRVGKFFLQKLIRFYFNYAHQVHNFDYTMRHAARAGYNYFYIRKPETKISVYQLTKTSLFINPVKFICPGPVAIFHHAVVGAHHTCKETKTNYALTILMFQALIIN